MITLKRKGELHKKSNSPSDVNTEYMYHMMQNPNVKLEDLLSSANLPTVGQLLNIYMGRRSMGTTALFQLAGLNEKFGFRVMKGERAPSRDVLFRFAFVLELNYEETQNLLKCGKEAALSAHRERDVVIMKALVDQMQLMEVEELLIDKNMEPLISK